MSVVGVTTCDYCRTRFRVQSRHAHLEGKPVRCPKCHREFILRIERPSVVEMAAIEESDEQAKQRTRRTKSQIRKEMLTSIRQGFRVLHGRLGAIAENSASSEEEVRRWCIDVLRSSLGYEDADIDTELRALNKRIDIAPKRDGRVFLVIECKRITSRMPESVRDQAVMYAVNKSADWAVVTNGQVWKLYRVFPQKGTDPKAIKVFDLALLDEDGLSDADIEMFYLLTSRALFSGETEKMYHQVACLGQRRIVQTLLAPRVLKAMRRSLVDSYTDECAHQVRLTDDILADRLRELFFPSDL